VFVATFLRTPDLPWFLNELHSDTAAFIVLCLSICQNISFRFTKLRILNGNCGSCYISWAPWSALISASLLPFNEWKWLAIWSLNYHQTIYKNSSYHTGNTPCIITKTSQFPDVWLVTFVKTCLELTITVLVIQICIDDVIKCALLCCCIEHQTLVSYAQAIGCFAVQCHFILLGISIMAKCCFTHQIWCVTTPEKIKNNYHCISDTLFLFPCLVTYNFSINTASCICP
jgi:hypothetical protein